MAFPIPSHLPRKRDNDVSTKLLTKMSETDFKSLSYEVASTWVTELDDAIRETKRRIHDRIQTDLPAFESQLSSAKSVQERLLQLGSNVDQLHHSIADSESGMIPQLIKSLTQHATLAQEALDTNTKHGALVHLTKCKKQLNELVTLTRQGKLPEAISAGDAMDHLLSACPPPLDTAEIMHDLKRNARAAKDRATDQLNEAYSRCIVVSAEHIIVRTSVPVRQSDTVLPLSAVVSSLPSSFLSSHMNTLRRDLTTHYIDHILKQPVSVSLDSHEGAVTPSEFKLTTFPDPPTVPSTLSRIENIAQVLGFLRDHLLPFLPQSSTFALSLCKPITTGILNYLLIPSLPSSIEALPGFLQLVEKAVNFERDYVGGLLGDDSPDKEVKIWADAVGAHYERKRRMELLECARTIITREENDGGAFRVEVVVIEDIPEEHLGNGKNGVVPPLEPIPAVEEDAWGLEEDSPASAVEDLMPEENGWDFDDEVEPDAEPELEVAAGPSSVEESTAPTEDPTDAWGWNDDQTLPPEDDETTDSSVWDDPWADEPAEPKPQPVVKPKAATRLEKLSNKGRASASATSSTVTSPVPTSVPPPTPAMPILARQATTPHNPPPSASRPTEKEWYVVSGRVKEIIFLVEDVLNEATQLSKSRILSSSSHHTPIGNILGQTSSFVLELYRALYPVTFANSLSASPKRAFCFYNDCLWLSDEVKRVRGSPNTLSSSKDKLAEGQDRLRAVADSWYEDSIDNQCLKVNETLDGTDGFRYTSDQDRYDECEAAINQVLQDIRRFAREVKPVVTKTKYFMALGSIVDAALSRILKDVLALSDIPEVESHRLSELCRILNALESLFVEDPNHPSFVVAYVPSWLKFSYLSELLEASIADISYLFEEKALVDFEIEELVKLVKALFADTPLRANAINKLMQGHHMS